MNLIAVGRDQLPTYSSVSISRTVSSILRLEVVDHGLGGIRLVEEPVRSRHPAIR